MKTLAGIMLSEISHTEKDKYHMISLTHGIKKKKTLKKKKQTHREQTSDCQRGGVSGG